MLVPASRAMPKFEPSDTWLFLALAESSQRNGWATLDYVLGAADRINHAIPTHREVEGGIKRLMSAGLMRVEGDRLSTTNHRIQATPVCACGLILAHRPGAPDPNRQEDRLLPARRAITF
jgi:hypothetical protein